jgi:hypothetical protein
MVGWKIVKLTLLRMIRINTFNHNSIMVYWKQINKDSWFIGGLIGK